MPSRPLFAARLIAGAALFALVPAAPAAQTVVQYGAEFLAGGVGARALGMGGAYVARANDVTAGYWNVAGLDGLHYPEAAYMHAERFAGIVAFDLVTWVLMLGLVLLVIGIDHPRTANDAAPLGLLRWVIGLASLLIPVLCFVPRPLEMP